MRSGRARQGRQNTEVDMKKKKTGKKKTAMKKRGGSKRKPKDGDTE